MLKRLFEIPASNTITKVIDFPVMAVSPMVAVIGAKGGVGTTSIVSSLAAAIAAMGIDTTIVDANLQQPDVAGMYAKEPEHSIMELLNRGEHLDKQVFEACAIKLVEGDLSLNLLSPPIDGSAAFKANLSQLAQCLDSVRSYSQFWLIDLPRHIDKHFVTLADKCDKILLVFEATVPGVATCLRWLSVFRELGYSKDKIICVLNRAGSKYSAVEQQLNDYFTDEIIFRIPNASSLAWESTTSGTPIAIAQPNHKYSQALAKLAQHLCQSLGEN